MDIEIEEIIELEDGKEFITFYKAEANGNHYLYLMSNYKPLEIRFAKILDNTEEPELEIINNMEEKQALLQLFQNENIR